MSIILYPPQNPVALNFLNFELRWYGIIIAAAMLLGTIGAYKIIKSKYSTKEAEIFLDFTPLLILFSIIGARLFYVIGDFNFYFKNTKEIFFINHGGLSLYGAITFGIVFILIYSKIKKINPLRYLDIISLVMPLCQSIGRWGNFCNQEAYGAATQGFIKLFVDETHRYPDFIQEKFYHPAFLYESILDFILFCILFFIFKKKKELRAGVIFCWYLILYSIIRTLTESIRIDSILNIGGIKSASILSFIAFTLGCILYRKLK